jgi:dynein heavy chain, axonemal
MTGFFNSQGFLTAMKQEVTRNHKGWALDDVVLSTAVTNKEKEELKVAPEEGVYVHGLYLDGCSWDKKKDTLVDSDPKVLFAALPVLHVSAVQAVDKKTDPTKTYECPCYTILSRTGLNYIVTLELRTEPDPPQKWIMRGVAVVCSKD